MTEWSEDIDGAIEGFCFLHTETGTEGGYWAVQDREFISKQQPKWGVWPKSTVYDAAEEKRKGEVLGVEHADGRPLPDPMTQDPTWLQNPKKAEEEWGRRVYGVNEGDPLKVMILWADGVEGQSLSTELLTTQWDYNGLHILRDGDRLTIYEKGGVAVEWSDTIDLQEFPLFTQDASGYWIHADQRGIEREKWAQWFLEEAPCRLWPRWPND